MRTLDLISNLSTVDATLFTTACSIALNDGKLLRVDLGGPLKQFGMRYEDILNLMAAGLLHGDADLTITYNHIDSLDGGVLQFGKKFIICKKENQATYKFDDISFTPSGIEIMNILNIEKDQNHLPKILEMLNTKGLSAKFMDI